MSIQAVGNAQDEFYELIGKSGKSSSDDDGVRTRERIAEWLRAVRPDLATRQMIRALGWESRYAHARVLEEVLVTLAQSRVPRLPPSLRSRATEKLAAITFATPSELNSGPASITLRSGESRIKLLLSICKESVQLCSRRVGLPAHIGELYDLSGVNACYSPGLNEIVVFPGMLIDDDGISTDVDANIRRLATIGMVLGHEITHAIDGAGIKYDGRGIFADVDPPINEVVKRRVKAIDDEFKRFSDRKTPLNAELMEGEVSADIGGIELALGVLENVSIGKVDRERVQQDRRIFFDYFARSMNSLEGPRRLYMALSDPHPPGDVRVNLTLANNPQFWEAEHIKEGSRMHADPARRIHLWD